MRTDSKNLGKGPGCKIRECVSKCESDYRGHVRKYIYDSEVSVDEWITASADDRYEADKLKIRNSDQLITRYSCVVKSALGGEPHGAH
jgi:hypothetical protein